MQYEKDRHCAEVAQGSTLRNVRTKISQKRSKLTEQKKRLAQGSGLTFVTMALAACGGSKGPEGTPGQDAPRVTIAPVADEPGNYKATATNASILVVFDQNGSPRFDSLETDNGGIVYGVSGFLPGDLETLTLHDLDLEVHAVINGMVYDDFLSSTAIKGSGNVTIFASQNSTTKVDVDITGSLTFDMASDAVAITLDTGSVIKVTGDLIIDDGTLDITALDAEDFEVGTVEGSGNVILNSGLIATVDQLANITGTLSGTGDLTVSLTSKDDVAKLAEILPQLFVNQGDKPVLSFSVDSENSETSDEIFTALKALQGNEDLKDLLEEVGFTSVVAPANTVLLVGEEDVKSFITIQEAINAASENDTIFVGPGTYDEVVTIASDKAGLTIIGSEEVTVSAFDVKANGVTIDNLNVNGGGNTSGSTAGVYVAASDVTLSNLTLTGPEQGETGGQARGILTETGKGAGLTVTNVTATDWATGIYLNPGATGAEVTDSTLTGNFVGMSIDGEDGVTLTGNTFEGKVEDLGLGPNASIAEATGNTFVSGQFGNYTGDVVTLGANTVDGAEKDSVILGTSDDDTLNGGSGNDILIGGAGNDTFVFSTIQALNGSDTVTDFGTGGNIIDFNFGADGELTQGDLRGDGTAFQSVAAEGTVSTNAGLIVVTDAQDDLTEAAAKIVAEALGGLNDEDQFFLAFDDGTSTAIFRIADTTDDGSFNADTVELLVTLQGVTADELNAGQFSDFG